LSLKTTIFAALVLLSFPMSLVLAAKPAARTESDAKKAESELQSVKSEIERITKEVSGEQVERDRLTKELRSAELSVGKARETLESVRHERAERASRRAALASEKRDAQASIAKGRVALAGQLRAAYLIGQEEPLKLLLNQKDPARAGRMFVYYSYFGRARAQEIHSIEDNVARLEQLDTDLAPRAAHGGRTGSGAPDGCTGQPRAGIPHPRAEPRKTAQSASRAGEVTARAPRGHGEVPGTR
jgi:murein hydrolase activator